MLAVFPYHTTAAGLHLRVQGTIVAKPGISADTTIGNWQFPHVDGLPIGVHITPEDVDLLRLTDAANANVAGFTDQFQRDLNQQVPAILWWLAGETLIGVLLGLAVAASINLGGALPARAGPPVRAGPSCATAGCSSSRRSASSCWSARVGGLTYNPRWSHQSKLTGTLGAVQLVPDQLAQYYNNQSKAFGVISAIAAIQAELQQQIGAKTETAADRVQHHVHLGHAPRQHLSAGVAVRRELRREAHHQHRRRDRIRHELRPDPELPRPARAR